MLSQRLIINFQKLCGLHLNESTASAARTLTYNDVETGQPVSIQFVRNPNGLGQSKTGDFAQNIEPHGTYLQQSTQPLPPALEAQGWVSGTVSFRKPLVVEYISTGPSGWKSELVKTYGKKGRALSQLLMKQGYDGIITRDSQQNSLEEIVSFQTFV